jgi:ribosomal protein S27AE
MERRKSTRINGEYKTLVDHNWKCPACQQPLILPQHLQEMEVILAARVMCACCGKTIFISDNVPTVDETA